MTNTGVMRVREITLSAQTRHRPLALRRARKRKRSARRSTQDARGAPVGPRLIVILIYQQRLKLVNNPPAMRRSRRSCLSLPLWFRLAVFLFRLESLYEMVSQPVANGGVVVDPEVIRKRQALGYINWVGATCW